MGGTAGGGLHHVGVAGRCLRLCGLLLWWIWGGGGWGDLGGGAVALSAVWSPVVVACTLRIIKVILRSLIQPGIRKRPSSGAKRPLKGTAVHAWDRKQSQKPSSNKRLKTTILCYAMLCSECPLF
jgi:hypothetical protein